MRKAGGCAGAMLTVQEAGRKPTEGASLFLLWLHSPPNAVTGRVSHKTADEAETYCAEPQA